MRLTNLQKISFPESIEEAVRILSDEKRSAVPLSGGVSFVFSPLPAVEELVSLRNLPLRYVKTKSGGLQIGATTLIGEMVESRAVRTYADGALWEAARRVGSTLNRNLITIGGSLVQPFIWSDLPTVALALGAKLRIHGRKIHTVEAEKFFAKVPKQLLKNGELVTEIVFPPLPSGSRTVYHKFTLTENDFALLKVAIVLNRRERLCRDITIVVGGAVILPQEVREAERVLRGKRVSQAMVNEASEVAAEEIKVAKDIRCTNDYKRQLCRVMVRGILEEIMLDQEVAETWKLL
jgi:carbon-monoxide dehydrogenase medium subunit